MGGSTNSSERAGGRRLRTGRPDSLMSVRELVAGAAAGARWAAAARAAATVVTCVMKAMGSELKWSPHLRM